MTWDPASRCHPKHSPVSGGGGTHPEALHCIRKGVWGPRVQGKSDLPSESTLLLLWVISPIRPDTLFTN